MLVKTTTRIFIWILFLVLFWSASAVLPQSQQISQNKPTPYWQEAGLPYIKNFTYEDFKTEGQNWTIVQDLRGVMYFGVNDGVLEYDGVSWHLIPISNKSAARSLAIDESGRIYVGAQGEFGYLAPDSLGQMRYISLLAKVNPGQREFADVWSTLIIDEDIYFVAPQYLFRWQPGNPGAADMPDSGQIRFWQPETSFHKAFVVQNAIYIWQRKIGLMTLTGDSLQMLPGGEQFADVSIEAMMPFPNDKSKFSIGAATDQPLMVLVGTHTQGLFLYDGVTFKSFSSDPVTNQFLQENRLSHGVLLADSSYALTTLRNGMIVISRQGRLRQILNKAAGMSTDMAFFAYPDRQGGLWLGLSGGISRVETPAPFTICGEKLGLRRSTLSIARHQDRFYAATYLRLFVLTSPPIEKPYSFFKPIAGINNHSWSLLAVEQTLLAATTDGVYRVEGERAIQLTNLTSYCLYRSRYQPNRVFVGLEDGLMILQNINGTWQASDRVTEVAAQVRYIVETEPGVLWLGTRTKGYLQVNISGENFLPGQPPEATVKPYGAEKGIPEGRVGVYFARDRAVFATPKGLRRFDVSSQTFAPDSSFGAAFADTSCYVSFLMEDHKGRVWIASNDETGMAIPGEEGHYTWHNLPFSRLVNIREIFTIYPDSNGVTWFGAGGGIRRYDPSIAKNYTVDFPALVRRVTAKGDSVIYGGTSPLIPLQRGNSETLRFEVEPGRMSSTLNYSANALRFEYAAPSFDDPTQNYYQVFLEGFDNRWSNWASETQKDYTNIPEGNYRFRVRAKNIYGHPSSEGVFEFTILPPWYRTWWAYLIYAGLAGISIFALVRWRVQRLQQRTKELETIVSERTREVRQQRDQLEEQAEKLQELDKMKSRFFANISHEFRTPLTLILGQIDSVLPLTSNTKNKNKLQMAFRNAKQLLRLINQLLDLSKLEARGLKLQAQCSNIVPFIRRLTYSFESAAEQKHLTLDFKSDSEIIEVYFDAEKIEKVMYNLLSNAFKFTPEGGRVIVGVEFRISELKKSSEIRSGASLWENQKSEIAEIRVSDSGIGIPAGKLLHIFDRFYQVDSSREDTLHATYQQGTGIGLALTKELLELHSGEISVSSEEGKGTTFVIRLPLGKTHLKPDQISDFGFRISDLKEPAYDERNKFEISAAQESPGASFIDPQSEISNPKSKKSEIILVVEDNADVRSYICEHLQDNYHVLQAENGEEGLAKAQETIPDLIITDVMMPKMNGYEFSNHIREDQRTSHIPIVMLTAKAAEEDKIEGLETGVDDYLTKPFSPQELRVRIRNLVEQRRKLRERFTRQTALKPSEIAVTSKDKEFLERVLAVVEANLGDEHFDIESLASEVAMSRAQLHRKLKALTNQSSGQFILSIRLQRAADLLKQNAATVSEIAYQTGFNNPSYFARCFKKQFGCSPTEFGS